MTFIDRVMLNWVSGAAMAAAFTSSAAWFAMLSLPLGRVLVHEHVRRPIRRRRPTAADRAGVLAGDLDRDRLRPVRAAGDTTGAVAVCTGRPQRRSDSAGSDVFSNPVRRCAGVDPGSERLGVLQRPRADVGRDAGRCVGGRAEPGARLLLDFRKPGFSGVGHQRCRLGDGHQFMGEGHRVFAAAAATGASREVRHAAAECASIPN